MNMQTALELCVNKGVSVRNKTWGEGIHLAFDGFIYDVVFITKEGTSKTFSPDKQDIMGEWEKYVPIQKDLLEIKEKTDELLKSVNLLCSKQFCQQCPLNFKKDGSVGGQCPTIALLKKMKEV